MSISKLIRNCSKNTTGLDFKIYVAPFQGIETASFSPDEELTGLTMTGVSFVELQADWNSVSLSTEGTTARSSSHTATLTAMFSHASSNFTKSLRELQNVINCGLVIIFRNGAGKWMISGIDPAERMGGSRPYLSLTHNYTSGEGIEAEDGNSWTLEFVKTSGEAEFYLMDEALSTEMNNKTATFVSW